MSPAHSGTMGQEIGKIWTAETLLQPILPKSDRLLGTIQNIFELQYSWPSTSHISLGRRIVQKSPSSKTANNLPDPAGRQWIGTSRRASPLCLTPGAYGQYVRSAKPRERLAYRILKVAPLFSTFLPRSLL